MTLETNKSVVPLFLLVADLAPCGGVAPVRLLALALPRDRFRVTIGVLNNARGQQFDDLREAGIDVQCLPIRNMIDLKGARLRQVVKEIDPAVIHCWGPIAAGAARLVIGSSDGANHPRLVVSSAAAPGGKLTGWLIARQVRRADRVIPTTRADGERYRQFGVSSERLTLIGPAISTDPRKLDRQALCKSLDIPATAQLLVAGGRSDRGIGPKDSIIAFDMLRYDNSQLHLVVFGTGTETVALEEFGRALAFDDFRIRFATCNPDRASAVQLASVVLNTHTRGGVEEALEAMAAGKPVVGWHTPELAEIIDDGVTGFLVPAGDRAALAARAQKLLDEPDLAIRMGEAGRTRVEGHFNVGRMIDQYTRLYTELASDKR